MKKGEMIKKLEKIAIAKNLTEQQTGTILAILVSLKKDFIDRRECVALKVWTNEDIASILKECGYKASKNNIKLVVETGRIDELNDCTDDEWDILKNAVNEAAFNIIDSDPNRIFFNADRFFEEDYNLALDSVKKDEEICNLGCLSVGKVKVVFSYHRNTPHSFWADFFVLGFDSGLGYTDDNIPYDYAGSIQISFVNVEIVNNGYRIESISYEEFLHRAEILLNKFMIDYDHDNVSRKSNIEYSLLKEAEMPLEVW